MFHLVDGEYRFDPSKVKLAHEWCQRCVLHEMGEPADIAVSNTFTSKWEYEPYIKMAHENGFDVQVIECHGPWENIHRVPYDVIVAMRERWEPHRMPNSLVSQTAPLREDLRKAIALLREGKRRFAPNTTNSTVDDFLAKFDRPGDGRGET
jgi:hypothetical protein